MSKPVRAGWLKPGMHIIRFDGKTLGHSAMKVQQVIVKDDMASVFGTRLMDSPRGKRGSEVMVTVEAGSFVMVA